MTRRSGTWRAGVISKKRVLTNKSQQLHNVVNIIENSECENRELARAAVRRGGGAVAGPASRGARGAWRIAAGSGPVCARRRPLGRRGVAGLSPRKADITRGVRRCSPSSALSGFAGVNLLFFNRAM